MEQWAIDFVIGVSLVIIAKVIDGLIAWLRGKRKDKDHKQKQKKK